MNYTESKTSFKKGFIASFFAIVAAFMFAMMFVNGQGVKADSWTLENETEVISIPQTQSGLTSLTLGDVCDIDGASYNYKDCGKIKEAVNASTVNVFLQLPKIASAQYSFEASKTYYQINVTAGTSVSQAGLTADTASTTYPIAIGTGWTAYGSSSNGIYKSITLGTDKTWYVVTVRFGLEGTDVRVVASTLILRSSGGVNNMTLTATCSGTCANANVTLTNTLGTSTVGDKASSSIKDGNVNFGSTLPRIESWTIAGTAQTAFTSAAVTKTVTATSSVVLTDMAGNTVTKTITVTKLTITASDSTKTYNGSAQTYSISAPTGGTVQYSTTSSTSGFSTEKPSLTNVGSVTVYVRAVPSSTSATANATIYVCSNVSTVTFRIQNATLSGSVKITGTNTCANTLTASVTNTNNATLAYQWYTNSSNSTSGGTAINGATSSTYKCTGTCVGNYVYVVVSATKSNYNNASWSDITDAANNTNATTIKATPTLTLGSASVTGLIYNGTVTNTVKSNVAGTMAASSSSTTYVTVSLNTTSVTPNTNLTATMTGKQYTTSDITITFTFTPTDTACYNNATKTFTVKGVAKLDIIWNCSAPSNKTYTGSAQTITCTASAGTVSFSWDFLPFTASDAGTGTSSTPSGTKTTGTGNGFTNAGKYTITATTNASSTNYSNRSTTVTLWILKANGSVTLSATSGSVNYGTSSTTFTVNSSHGGTLSVTDNNSTAGSAINGTTVTLSSLSTLTVGTSVVATVKSAATANYKEASATYTLTFTKTGNPITVSNKTVYVLSATDLSTLVSNAQGAVTYTLGTDNCATKGSLSGSTYTAGSLSTNNDNDATVTFTVTAAGNTNYNSGSKTITLTVQKYTRTLAFNSSTPSSITYGATGKSAVATASGSGGTAGSITYTSNNADYLAINSSTGALTAKAYHTGVTITASLSRTATVKATSKTVTIAVARATGNITLSKTSESMNYGATSTKTFTVTAYHSGATLSVSDDNGTAGSAVSGTTVTLSSLSGISPTTIKVTVTASQTAQYNAASAIYTLTIGKAGNPITVSNKTVYVLSATNLSTLVSGAQGTVTYTLGTDNCATKGSLSGSTYTAGSLSTNNDDNATV
ncbi:MAG: hypothetical protein E7184_02205, partial [Erysipelotrichaceae bacterium]|nr:hypothetical protein [Erysipelotrichaceae bacterium]